MKQSILGFTPLLMGFLCAANLAAEEAPFIIPENHEGKPVMMKILDTRLLCDGMKGQNYWFNGCMEYAMECLGEDIAVYNYWFFSNITGDSLMQLYGKDIRKTAWCPSRNVFDHAFAKRAFDACGYEFEFATGITDANRAEFFPRIKASIDKNIPVICRDGKEYWDALICGYEDDKLYYLICDKEHPEIFPASFEGLIFIGAKKERPAPAEVYKRAVMDIPSFLTRPSTAEYAFGKQAFVDWAGRFQDGTFDNVPAGDINAWNVHGTYLCQIGTNGCADDLLWRARETNSEMAPMLDELRPLYEKWGEIFHVLAYRDADGNNDYQNGGLLGGFNIKPEAIKDKAAMKTVSDKIMEAAGVCDEILAVFKKYE